MEMVRRCCEISMKLGPDRGSLGCPRREFIIDRIMVRVNYVRFHSDRAIDSRPIASAIRISPPQASQVLRCITKNGERGRTVPDMTAATGLQPCRNANRSSCWNPCGSLKDRDVTIKSTRGKPCNAWGSRCPGAGRRPAGGGGRKLKITDKPRKSYLGIKPSTGRVSAKTNHRWGVCPRSCACVEQG